MPLPFLASIINDGWPAYLPAPLWLAKAAAAVSVVAATKWYASGHRNPAERDMHGRVVLLTGGTSGIGAEVAADLAARGAQLVLLTRDPFAADFVEDLRARTANDLIYAERLDLRDLHAVRRFATRWIDNSPPRRLDMVVLCAATLTPPGHPPRFVGPDVGDAHEDPDAFAGANPIMDAELLAEAVTAAAASGVESTWMVNYLANFHLLALLSPALRAQPFDRDVRVIIPTCSSYIGSPPLDDDALERDIIPSVATSKPAASVTSKLSKHPKLPQSSSVKSAPSASPLATPAPVRKWSPTRAYARSKLALMVFARAYQKHLDSYKRPDGLPSNARVFLVDPGLARTPGMQRWLTRGTLWGLFIYTVLYAFAWLLLKSPTMGAQSVLFAALEGSLARGPGGALIKECMPVDCARKDVHDEEVAKRLWEASDRLVERVEKELAARRARVKKRKEEREQQRREREEKDDISSLVDAIKKGKQREAAAAAAKKEKGAKKTGKQGEGSSIPGGGGGGA